MQYVIKAVTMYRENKRKFRKTQNRLVSPNCDIKFDLISVCFSPLPTILAEKLLTLRSLQLQLLRTVKQKTFFANFCRNSPLLPLLNFKLHLQNFSTKAILKTMPILIYKCHLWLLGKFYWIKIQLANLTAIGGRPRQGHA